MSDESPVDFYCNQKFTWLTADLEKRLIYSCCSADPVKIDLQWLSNNPGQLFNMPALQQDRIDMLNNIPIKSCNTACWQPESANLPSRRSIMGSTARTHTNVNSQPTTVNIDIGSTCNLTCSYCCKQFSSAWTRDIRDNGSYLDTDRFKLTNSDLISINVSQKEHQDSAGFNLLVGELEKFSNLEKIIISGGEPFLYSNFVDLLNYISGTRSVIVYSGLGVNSDRLNTQLKKIQNKKQITIRISGENTHQFYEFNRYSNSYTKFKNNIELLLSHGFNIEFAATLSNLTVFGLVEFLEEFADYKTHYQFCNDPEFLRVSVLDDATKQRVIEQISLSDILIKAKIIDAIEKPCTDQQRRDLSCYLKEFVRRRALSLEIFPKSLLQWLEIQK